MAITRSFAFTIDLDKDAQRLRLGTPLATLDKRAHVFSLTIQRAGKAASMDNVTCTAYFVRADGVTVPIDGTVTGNVVSLTLLPNCYAVPGRFTMAVKLLRGTAEHTVLWVEGNVATSRTDSITSGGSGVQSFDELASAVELAEFELRRRDRVADLVVNGYFPNAVNQRGAVSYTGIKYGIDGWKGGTSASTVELTEDGLKFTHSGASGTSNVWQALPEALFPILKDATLTVAACLSDGTIICRSGIPSAGPFNASFTGGYVQVQLPDGVDQVRVRIVNSTPGSSVTLRWVAVYEGAYTLDSLPTYTPKPYALTLLECQRFFHVYATQAARPANGLDAAPPMRINAPTQGTVSIDGVTHYYNSAEL